MPKIGFWFLLLGLVLAGCGTRTTMGVHDASSAPDAAVAPDSAANADASVLGDALVKHDVLPDLVSLSDAASDEGNARRDVAAEVTPDRLASPEAAPDQALRDSLIEVLAPDLPVLVDLGGDGVLRDQTVEPLATDAFAPETAADIASEVARDLQPFVVDGALASFCSGDTPHMIVNGIESYPTVTGNMIPLDCCDAGQLTVATQTFSELITFRWQRFSEIFQYPAAVDLANPPSSWSLRLYAGCDPMLSSCTTPGDGYTTGLDGQLEVNGTRSQIEMTLCLHVQEPAGSPHSILHTLDLYAPHIVGGH